jgi:hypothetical protein
MKMITTKRERWWLRLMSFRKSYQLPHVWAFAWLDDKFAFIEHEKLVHMTIFTRRNFTQKLFDTLQLLTTHIIIIIILTRKGMFTVNNWCVWYVEKEELYVGILLAIICWKKVSTHHIDFTFAIQSNKLSF